MFQSKRSSSVLGLSLDGNRLEGVVVRRAGGSVHARNYFSVNLALSPLTGDPELVGREIRNHLDGLGIRERNCALCLPLHWVLSIQTAVPDLPEADRVSFLQLEAERGFHSDDLLTFNSIFKTGKGEARATILSVSRGHLSAIENVLKAAKLKPATFGLGVSAMQPAAEDKNRRIFTLAIGSNSLGLQVTYGGGVVAMRSLDSALETEGPQKRLSADLVARELRITHGQLPGDLAESGGVLKVFGQSELARQFINDIGPRLGSLGLSLEAPKRATSATIDGPVSEEAAMSPAMALAAAWVRGIDTIPDFLPPKISAWQQFTSNKASSQRLAWAGGAVGFAVLCLGATFGVQQWHIHSLQSEYDKMKPHLDNIDAAQTQISKFGGWYDSKFTVLQALRKLEQAFPEDGTVTAKTYEIRDLATVNCVGVARSELAFRQMSTKLQFEDGVTNVHAEVPNAKIPLQFTLSFQLVGAPPHGND